ncbi:ATP-dependent DNA helicase RecG [Campylobacter sp. 19-13652]|uniref:ATP-dependent DNA helicase RecG n=1 Tax=Campylobacter sp. 19-13652 TaxID=2840180 RepID=UPI001C7607C0|nr:ATP-dependent DNA helicase RecG [Campylobacter sp. 19-13652]BCX79647.1 ATP-dependent DNA helicase RecG [Campylobacter sp. 19-13652]
MSAFSKQDAAKLAKIGVFSLLDLALYLPSSVDDTTLTQSPKEGAVCVSVKMKHSRRASGGMMIALAWCEQWECEIKVVIFHAKPWHFGAFGANKELVLSGKCHFVYGSYQLTNPRIITNINSIILRYKSELKSDELAALVARYVSRDALLKEGLNADEAEALLSFHSASERGVWAIAMLESEDSELIKRLKFIEIFNYIKKLSAKKTTVPASPVALFDIKGWLGNLPFTPTADQLAAISDVRNDLVKPEAARRVVMGDVGSGKTLVILASALSVYPDTAVLMAPTSILAEQLYDEAKRLLPEFMSIRLVLGGGRVRDDGFGDDIDETDEIQTKKPLAPNANLIIGTHALLYMKLPEARLVMVDEQHRFGSAQRQLVSNLASSREFSPHFVQFSATPIPRTLSLIQSFMVKFSFLKQIPFKKHIITEILQPSGFSSLITHIKSQISQGKQTIIVYPLVNTSEASKYQSLDEASAFWLANFKNVFITHGKDREKERILREFRQSGDILLSTTVVEVGISLPRLSTIVIVGAERLGLATLHQLRGRVGRNGGVGWCFLFTKLKTPPARLVEFCTTLDGFKVAAMDLKNRQSGDILSGFSQHGATFKFYDYEEEITQAARDRLTSFK